MQFAFASFSVVGKVALRELSPPLLVGLRMAGGALAFQAATHLLSLHPRPTRRDHLSLAGLSLLGIVINQAFFVEGLALTSATHATLLICTTPAFSLIFSVMIGRDTLDFRRTAGLVIAFVGVGVIVGISPSSLGEEGALGDLMVTLNAASYGAFLVLSRDLLRRIHALAALGWLFTYGCVLGLPYAWLATESGLSDLSGTTWLAIAWCVGIATIFSYGLNYRALQMTSPLTTATYIFTQPIIAAALAAVFLEETLTLRTLLGALMIVPGVLLVLGWGRSWAKGSPVKGRTRHEP